jgi:Zn-finger nucleic acid-binding protein
MSDSPNETLKSPASDADLIAVQFQGCTIYRDPETKGHWLPKGQLKALAEGQVDLELPPLLEIDEESMHHGGRLCPEDQIEMVEYEFAESGIKIEQCLSCKGVWLDQGELKKVMDYVFEHTDEMSHDEYEEASKSLSISDRILLFLYRTTEHPPWIG